MTITPIQRKKNMIINAVFVAVIVLIAYLFFQYIVPIVAPFLFAFLVAIALQHPLAALCKKTGANRTLMSVILVLLTLTVLGAVIGFVLSLIINEAKGITDFLMNKIKQLPQIMGNLQASLISFVRFLPDETEKAVADAINEFFAGFKSGDLLTMKNLSLISMPIGNGLWGAAKQLPNAILITLVTIISSCFITADYREIVNFIRRQFSEKHKNLITDIKQVFVSTVLRMLRAYLLLMFITFCELTLAFAIMNWTGIFKNSYIFTIALIIAVVDILPVLGTGTVLIPWALYSLIVGNTPLALGLGVTYAVIAIVRNFAEPKIIGHQIGLKPIITLFCIYTGLKLFGVVGMFAFPITVIIIKLLHDSGKIHIWRTEGETIDS